MKLDAAKLKNLDLIIKGYEEKVVESKDGDIVALNSWKALDSVEETNKQIVNNISTRNKIEKTLEEASSDKSLENFEKGIRESLDGASDFVNNLSDKIEELPSRVFDDLKNEMNKVFDGPLKDCLPCKIRGKGDLFDFKLNLDLLTEVNKFLESLKEMAKLLLPDPNLFKKETICILLNTVNLSCKPDNLSLNLMLSKNLDLKFKEPKFSIPSLSDIVLFLVSPIFLSLSVVVESWLGLVLQPVQCMIDGIENQIKRIENQFSGNSLNVGVDLSSSILMKAQTGISQNTLTKEEFKVGVSDKEVKIKDSRLFQGVKTGSDAILSSMKLIKDKIVIFKTELEKHFRKNIFEKATQMVQLQVGGLEDIIENLKNIQEVYQFLSILNILNTSIEIANKECSTQKERIEKTREVIEDELQKTFPGNIRLIKEGDFKNGPVDNLTKQNLPLINLTEEEIKILGIESLLRPLRGGEGDGGAKVFSLKPEIKIDQECFGIISNISFHDTTNLVNLYSS